LHANYIATDWQFLKITQKGVCCAEEKECIFRFSIFVLVKSMLVNSVLTVS